eukprot:89296_1
MSTLLNRKTNGNKVNKYPLKIIHAGFHRGGTTSIANALKILGFGRIWHTAINWNEWIGTKGLLDWINKGYDQRLLNGEEVDLDEWLQLVQCPVIMDAPVELHWDTFFDQYPDAKVILSVREFDAWYQSIQTSILGLFYSRIANILGPLAKTARWARNTYLKAYIEQMEIHNKETARSKYFEKIEYVKSKVPPKQCLIYEVGSGWEPLCTFLQKEIPKQPFPHSNAAVSVKKFVYIGLLCEVIFTLIVYGSIVAAVVLPVYGYRWIIMWGALCTLLVWNGFA